MSFDFSYIISFRRKAEDRYENLSCVLKWLKKYQQKYNFEIIIVEQDDSKKCCFENCNHIFVYNKGGFNRSWGFNIGALGSQSDILVFGDSDVLINWDNLMNAIEHCKTYWEAVSPKNIMYDLVESHIDNFSNSTQISARRGICFGSALTVMRKDAFLKINGWDENFRGWGAEDDVLSLKVEKMLTKSKTIKFPIYHLNHQIVFRYVKGAKYEGEQLENLNLYRKIQKMNKESFFPYYKDRKIGDVNKYIGEK